MMGLQGLIIKADALDVTGGSKKESLPDTALFAALLGGEVQQAEVKELRNFPVPEMAEPLFIKPATPVKRETAKPSVLDGAALFPVVGLMEETPDTFIKSPFEPSIGLGCESQPSAEFGNGQSPEETVLPNDLEHVANQMPQPASAFQPLPKAPADSAGHPSEGGELLKSPPSEGCRSGGVGFPAVHTTAHPPLNVKPEASAETIVLPEGAAPAPSPVRAEPDLSATKPSADSPVPSDAVQIKKEFSATAPVDGLIQTKEQTEKPVAGSVTNGAALSSVQPNPPRPSATPPAEGNFSQDVSICTDPLSGGVAEGRGGFLSKFLNAVPFNPGTGQTTPIQEPFRPEPVAVNAIKVIHPEILAAMETERKRTLRTALDPIMGREPAAPETIRTAQVPPAHAGAAAIPLSDSRAADLQKLIDTFDRHMLSMVQHGDKMTRVTLNSREMGRLTVVCHEETSGLKIEIQAQNSTVQAALQRHETAVRQLLQAHGSAVGKFDVTCGDGRNTDPRRFGRGRGFFEEFPDGGIEPACSAGNEIEPLMARAPAHAVSIFA